MFTLKLSDSISKDSKHFSKEYQTRLLNSFKETINTPQYGFFKLTEDMQYIEKCENVFKKFKDRKTFVHVGIGGSSLGPEMLINALQNKETNNTNFIFINNIDSETIFDDLLQINPENSCFYIVSKSGGTAETMSAFAILSSWLNEKGIKEESFKNYFVFNTDPVKSELRTIGEKLEIEMLPVPSSVGGRYSVLTPVGILPALFAGIDPKKIYKGSENIKENLLSENNNMLLDALSTVLSLYENKSVSQTVFMPYSSKLKYFSSWFVQLWAESLGKEKSNDGKTLNGGLTPIFAYGATDQHSQMQLFMEGPFDKLIILIEIKKPRRDFNLKTDFKIPSLVKLSNYSLNQLMKAELEGTKKALENNKRPFISITTDELNEENLGALILFFESLTVITGHAINVNPFDQPGVELGKRYAYEWLTAQK